MYPQIVKLLKHLEKKHNMSVLWAVESGSRAWGFGSEDSDYDIRGVFKYPASTYLGIEGFKEQIEIIQDKHDLVLWDIRKFAKLFLKSNPQVAEWLRSPIVYLEWGKSAELKKQFDRYSSLDSLYYHYKSMAAQNYRKYLKNDQHHSCKKYLYVLRALACACYIEKYGKVPPVPYKKTILSLPVEIQLFFTWCVTQKLQREKTLIIPQQNVVDFIEASLSNPGFNKKITLPDAKHWDKKLNTFVIDSIIV